MVSDGVLAQEERFGPFSLAKGHCGAVINEPWAAAPCLLPSHDESSALPLWGFGAGTSFRGRPSISAQTLQHPASPNPGPCRGLMLLGITFVFVYDESQKSLLGLPNYKWGI